MLHLQQRHHRYNFFGPVENKNPQAFADKEQEVDIGESRVTKSAVICQWKADTIYVTTQRHLG